MVETTPSHALAKAYKPIITKDEELDLFQKIRDHDDQEAVTKLIMAHTPIIRKAEKKLSGYNIDSEELISEGFVALTKAVQNFKPNNGNRFAAYASSCVRCTMLSYIVKNSYTVNAFTNRQSRKIFFSLRKKVAELLQDSETEMLTHDMIQELAKDFEVNDRLIMEMNGLLNHSPIHFDEPVSNSSEDDGVTSKYEILLMGALGAHNVYEDMQNTEFQQKLIELAMTNVLDPRERRIISARSLAEKEDELTLHALGTEFEVSKERIRQVETIAMKKLSAEIRRLVREKDVDIQTLLQEDHEEVSQYQQMTGIG